MREELDHYLLYQPSKSDIPEFNNFRKLEDQVRKLVMSTKSKSCELDPTPTTLLKNIIPSILPAITKIINLSLQSGIFPQSWKTAIVTPILKKSKEGISKIELQICKQSTIHLKSGGEGNVRAD